MTNMTADITAVSNIAQELVIEKSSKGLKDSVSISALNVTVNVGRAVLQRAMDFKTKQDALFEGIANAYEAYDLGEAASVDVTIATGKNGFVTIADKARGMDRNDLARFFSLHAHTERRVGGRNLRGYNGTGKVAPLVVGRTMRVDSVRNGYRNVVVLTLDAVEKAARTNTPIDLKEMVINEVTNEPNGTTITISKLHSGFNAEDVRDVREKIALEMMMWMKGAAISVNDEAVEAQKVAFDEEHHVTSDCGNFNAHIMYRAGSHPEELAYTYITCGAIFVARENFGKEGHKFSNKVHAVISTTAEWAEEHFNHRRERFVSESRDLKLKTSDVKAREVRDFAIKAVSDYMKKLVDEEEKRRKEEDNQLLREWESDLSRSFSSMWDLGGKRERQETNKDTPAQPRERVKRETPAERKTKVSIEFKALDDHSIPYQINEEARFIEVNLNHEHARCLPKVEEDPTRRQALMEVALDAFVELKSKLSLTQEFETVAMTDPVELMKRYAEISRTLKADIKSRFVERYRAFATIRSA